MSELASTPSTIEDVMLAHRVQAFLAHEASLLDAGRFDDWLNLFSADGLYWLPSSRDQSDPHGQVSIIYEDRQLLSVRVARLSHPAAHALEHRPATAHLVGNVHLPQGRAEPVVVNSTLMMTEHRDGAVVTLAGLVTHHLRPTGDKFEIALKRVDLLDCRGVLPAITIPL